jgi:8-hydroxy-5-deazaflavin:NADPH oxidoreductase
MKKIAIIGGTGKEGKGLAYRWARSGHEVTIGSRTLEKAQTAVEDLLKILPPNCSLMADLNHKAVEKCEVAVITVPYSAHKEIVQTLRNVLQGKMVIDVTVPIVPPQVTKVHIPQAGSAAQEAHEILGIDCRIASAFHNISYDLLMHDTPIECDVLVCGTDENTRLIALELVRDAGLIGWDAGSLENSVVAESLTSILIHINRKYKATNAGIRITGIK